MRSFDASLAKKAEDFLEEGEHASRSIHIVTNCVAAPLLQKILVPKMRRPILAFFSSVNRSSINPLTVLNLSDI
jgi:hypothetical protein